MSQQFDPALHQALSGEMTPKFLATLDAHGRPNCVPVISITPYPDGTLIFGEFFMNKTRRNLLENAKVGIAVLTEAFEGWSLKGTFLGFEDTGERVEYINNTPLFRYNAYTTIRSAGTIRVEEISEKRTLSKGQILRDYLHARMAGPLFPGVSHNGAIMPAPVMEKYRRMQAIRAAAFRDADGFPRAIPLMAAVAANSNRLILRNSLFPEYAKSLSNETELAVAIITPEPIAYQVKGRYAGKRAGVESIELTACYSASPPLLGERLDRAESVPATM